jgi:cobalt-zinc-cadmium efflux system protein
LTFTIFEIIGGLWTNSLAILSDAVHDLGDSLSLGLAWYLEKVAEKEGDHTYSYGYRRFSLLGALINTIILIVGGLFVLSEAIPRLLNPEHSNAQGMLLFAIAGILVNGAAVLRLRGGKSVNTQVVTWHLLEDVLGWIAVLIVSIVLLIWDIHVLDPILSILITLYVLYNVVRNLRKTLRLFLQSVPDNVELAAIEERLQQVENVRNTHHTHIWSLDGQHHVLTTHVVVDEAASKEQMLCIKEDIRHLIHEFDITHVTVEIEFGDSNCIMTKP